MKQKRKWMDSEQAESDEADVAKANMKEQKSDSNGKLPLVFISSSVLLNNRKRIHRVCASLN